jgi:hypothetical protein
MMVIKYEDFVLSPKKIASQLAEFAGLESPIPLPEVKLDSVDKWRKQLTVGDIQDIRSLTGVSESDDVDY